MTDKNVRQNTSYGSLTSVFLMIFSLALLLILIGMYVVVALHSAEITRFLKESTTIVMELRDDMESEQRDTLTSILTADPRLIAGSSSYISNEEAMEFMREELGEKFLPDSLENPFSDILSVKVKAEYTSEAELILISNDYQEDNFVQTVYFQNDHLDYWQLIKKRIFQVSMVITIVLLILTVLLIYSTVKISLYSKQYSITLLESLGASWSFIMNPFLRVAVKMGVVSALVASIALAALLSLLAWRVPEMVDYFNWTYMVVTFVLLSIFSIALQYFSTKLVVNRSLNKAVRHFKS